MSKPNLIFVVFILLGLMLTNSAFARIEAADGIFIDVQFRPRFEFDNRDFNNSTGYDQYISVRSRLGIAIEELIPSTKMYFMIGDSRMMGYQDPYNLGRPVGPNGFDNNLGMIKAYIELSDFGCSNMVLKIGRMSNDQGRGRIFGRGNWNLNGPRTYDGVKLGYANSAFDAHLWHLYGKLGDRHWYPESTTEYINHKKDHTLTGADLTFCSGIVNLMGFLDLDQDPVVDTINGGTNLAASRITIASYFKWRQADKQGLALDLDLGYQTGSVGCSWGKSDISAYLLAGDIAYHFDNSLKSWAGIGWDIISGDVNPNNLKERTFYEEYYSKHRFQGDMDLFKKPNSSNKKEKGLQDFILRAGFSLCKELQFQIDLHHFRVERSFPSAVDGTAAHNLGQEIDTFLEYKLRQGVKIKAVFDIFFPTETWRGNDADPATFIYTVITASL